MLRHWLRIVALIVCWVLPSNAMAVEAEEVTLEEEPAPAAKSKPSGAAKKKKKKKRAPARAPAATEEAEEDDVEVEVVVEEAPSKKPAPARKAAEEPAKKKKKKRRKEPAPAADDAAAEKAAKPRAAEEEAEEDEGPVEPIDCFPELKEVETRRPIPLACTFAKPIAEMEVRYRPPGDQWKTSKMKKVGDEWTAEIPCAATIRAGELELTIEARSKRGKVRGKLDPLKVKLSEVTTEPPPSIPGQEPPARCFDPAECPGDMLGSPSCPGTKKGVGVRSWGASCTQTTECTKGLACVAGTCESPPKCKSDDECESGVCSGGVCEFPDPEEMKSRLGPPKYHWVGLELGVDFKLVPDAVGVCGSQTDDSDVYDCFEGGDEYDGLPNVNNAGKVAGGPRLATMRALLSYQRPFGRLMAGARVGFAFRGAPDGFLPLHLELRGAYSLTTDPLKKRWRPYLGLAFGLAQVDTRSDVTIVDCASQECANRAQITSTDIMLQQARLRDLTAYRSGKKLFFGPTFSLIYALSNESGVVFTTNVMFPDLVISPSVGYLLGL